MVHTDILQFQTYWKLQKFQVDKIETLWKKKKKNADCKIIIALTTNLELQLIYLISTLCFK